MKKILVVLLVALMIGCTPKVEDCMAVEFSGSSTNRIDFGTGANVYGLTQKSISFWIYPDTVANTYSAPYTYLRHIITLFGMGEPYTSQTFAVLLGLNGNGRITFYENFDDTAGEWRTGDVVSASSWQHVVILYDNSSVANDPSIYVDGTSKSITEETAPVGSVWEGTNSELKLGSPETATLRYSLDGKLQDVRIYDVILTPQRIANLAKSRCQNQELEDLVFWSRFNGAKGLSAFDGVALGAGNTLLDEISGAVGVPYGSPIGRANTIQRIN